MRILFEDYGYATKDVSDILGSFMQSGLEKSKEKTFIKHVGYFYNKNIENTRHGKGDLVFILPKVLLDEPEVGKEVKTAFGLPVEDYLRFDLKEWKNKKDEMQTNELSEDKIYRFVYAFSTWIYRAVDVYSKNLKHKPKEKNDNDQRDEEAEVSKSNALSSLGVKTRGSRSEGTFMDVMLALLDFQRDHKNFIFFMIKSAHSGFNKINWQKTISHSTPIIQDDVPIYMNLVNKKKFIDFDEELLVIYYSILNYMHEEYGFPKVEQPGYEIIKGVKFHSLLNNVGKMRLRRIKNKYFSDSAVLLWNLCYAFFDYASDLKGTDREDYLLVNSFHCVFEAMIDELLGDKNLPEGLKTQSDDKRIDHLYTYKYLLEKIEDATSNSIHDKDIYNIADSKYYRRDKGLKGHDVPKQFTYARNVTQWHMDLLHGLLYSEYSDKTQEKKLNEAEEFKEIPLYDEKTEGYNIIPNFFISAKVDDNLDYDKENLHQSSLENANGEFISTNYYTTRESYQFWERLFDRDSLFTLHYDVNFLFILKRYAQNKSNVKTEWRYKARTIFRENILSYLNDTYDFYQIMIKSDKIQDYVDRNFRRLAGKVFSFKFNDKTGERVLLYAERKDQNNHKENGYIHKNDVHSHIDKDVSKIIIPGDNTQYPVSEIILGKGSFYCVEQEPPVVSDNSLNYNKKTIGYVFGYSVEPDAHPKVADHQFEYPKK